MHVVPRGERARVRLPQPSPQPAREDEDAVASAWGCVRAVGRARARGRGRAHDVERGVGADRAPGARGRGGLARGEGRHRRGDSVLPRQRPLQPRALCSARRAGVVEDAPRPAAFRESWPPRTTTGGFAHHGKDANADALANAPGFEPRGGATTTAPSETARLEFRGARSRGASRARRAKPPSRPARTTAPPAASAGDGPPLSVRGELRRRGHHAALLVVRRLRRAR